MSLARAGLLVGVFACLLVAAALARPAAAQKHVSPATSAQFRSGPSPLSHAAPILSEDEAPPDDEPTASASASAVPPVPSAMLRPGVPFKDGMLLLPRSRFLMGNPNPKAPPNERPTHFETVGPFWLDRTEVTVGAYRACVDKNLCRVPAQSSPMCSYAMGDSLLPVSCVHYEDADTYCRAKGKRLPREVEWEFAARATTKALFPWGGSVTTCSMAATLINDSTARSCSGKRPSRVGAHPFGGSPFGVLDMSGNVEEWTSDWYSEGVAGGAAPSAGASHTLRGGGWLSGPSMSRTTSRNWGSMLEAGANVGFRCARDVGPDEAAR